MSLFLRALWSGNHLHLSNMNTSRNISGTLLKFEKTPMSEKKPPISAQPLPNEPGSEKILGPITHKVKRYQKWALVWTGRYKSVEEIPDRVSHAVLDRALNKARIKIAIYMMVVTALGCLGFVYLGKQDVQRGESLTLQNMEYHRQLKEGTMKEKAPGSK